jgi:integrase
MKAVRERIPNDRWLTPSGEWPCPHGFRSGFTNWCAETRKPADVREQCLAHTERNSTVRAYLTTDLIGERQKLLSEWADFCNGADLK